MQDAFDLFNLAPVGYFILDRAGTIEEANLAGAELFEVEPAALRGRAFTSLIAEKDMPRLRDHLQAAVGSERRQVLDLELRRGDGTVFSGRLESRAVRDESGGFLRCQSVLIDGLNAREQPAADRFQEGQRRVLEMLAEGATLEDVLETLVHLIEEQAPGMLASVLVMDEGGRYLREGAAPSLPEAYNRAIDGLEIGEAVGSCGTAAYRGEQVIVTDIQTDPLWKGYRELAGEHGLAACWSTPIHLSDGEVAGTFAMYFRTPRTPGPREFDLIGTATHLAGIAIERKRAEESAIRLHREEAARAEADAERARLEAMIQQMPVGVIIAEAPSGKLLLGNEQVKEIWRQPFLIAANEKGYDHYRAFHPDGQPYRPEDWPLARAITGGETVFGEEIRFQRGDGTQGVMRVNAGPIRNGAGAIEAGVAAFEDITEQKRAELLLLEQKRLLELIATGCPLDECLSALCATVPRLNPHARASILLADDERLTFPRAIAPDLLPSFGQGLKDVPINDLYIGTCGEAVYSNQPVTCSDIANDDRWSKPWRDLCLANGILACHSTPISGADGLPVASFMLCFDEPRELNELEQRLADFGIHVASIAIERDRANKALHSSEDRFRTTMEQSPLSMQIFDAEGRTVAVNPAWERLWDTPREALGGYNILEDEQLEAAGLMPYIRRAFAGEVVRLPETYYDPAKIGKTGRDRWIDGYIYPLGTEDGETFEVALVHHDITERKRAEEESRELNAKMEQQARIFDTTLSAITDFAYIFDHDGRFVYVNKALLDLWGLELEQAVGKNFFDLQYPDDLAARLQRQIQQVFDTKQGLTDETPYTSPTGAGGYYEYIFSPVFGADGAVEAVVGSTRDITERNQAEEALHESEARLEAELADAKLLQYVSAQLIYEDDVDALYEEILDAVVGIMRSEYASLQMLYPERGNGGELRLLAFRGFNPQAAAFWEWVRPESASTCGVALTTCKRVIAPDVDTCAFMAGTEDLATYLQTGIHAVQTTPLISRGGQMLGAISTHWREPHEPSERDLRLLDILARQAADLIERKQAEEALRESEERYRTLLESIDEGFCVLEVLVDEDGTPTDYRFLETNPAFERQTGLEDATGKLMREFAPAHEQHWFDIYGKVALTGEPVRFVNRAEALHRWYDVYAIRVGLPEQRRVAVLFNDITEKKRAEDALRKSEERFRATFEQAAVGISHTTPDGHWLRANRKFQEITGYSLEDLSRLTFQEITYSEDREESRRVVRQLLAGEVQTAYVEKRYIRKDGSVVWANLTTTLKRDAAGEPEYFISVTEDISSRKKTEDALRESEQRLREIFVRAPAIIATLRGPDHVYESANPLYLQIVGNRDIIGKPIREALPELAGQGIYELLDRVYQTGEPFTASELPVMLDRRGEGIPEQVFLNFVYQPLSEADGSVSGIFVHAVDVTEQVRARQGIKRLNDTLEMQVEQRTAELRQTNSVLEQKNRELQDFAYVASHDLQEPLRKIITFADLLQEDNADELDDTGTFYIQRMQESAGRMSGLIRDLLSFSRVATHGQSIRDVDLNQVLAGVLSDLEVSIAESGAEIESDPLPTIEADPVQMHQLFQNLIGNAIKFRRADVPPLIRVSGALETDDPSSDGAARQVCRMRVEDNGIGFEEKYLDRIFAPFQRLHTRLSYEGAGIGLAICRRIVERHHGTITAHSTPGQGSTFVVTLPAEQLKFSGLEDVED